MPKDPATDVWFERRRHFRVTWNLPATIYDVDQHLERPCVLSDLSAGGAKLSRVRANTIPDEFRLRTPDGDRRSCHVVWRTDNELGVRFTDGNEGGGSRKEKESAGH
jgi:PilZ domain-containing protein